MYLSLLSAFMGAVNIILSCPGFLTLPSIPNSPAQRYATSVLPDPVGAERTALRSLISPKAFICQSYSSKVVIKRSFPVECMTILHYVADNSSPTFFSLQDRCGILCDLFQYLEAETVNDSIYQVIFV